MMAAMYSGVAGLTAHQTEMDVIGNNIANVDTVGFKSSSAIFESQVSQTLSGAGAPNATSGGTNPLQVGLGVGVASIDLNLTQGSMQTTGQSTDLAINGAGMFILNQNGQNYFTRNGAFGLDSNANLVNPSNGMFVEGWNATNTGVINTNGPVGAIQTPLGNTIIAQASANAAMQGNLNSGTPIGGTVNSTVTLNDSLGNPVSVDLAFTNVGPDQWNWTAAGPGIAVGAFNQGTITYTVQGGVAAQTGALEINNPASGAAMPQDVNIDFGKITQFSTPSSVSPQSQDGYDAGTLTSFTIGQDGVITGTFTNGVIRGLGELALAGFSNPGGLSAVGSSLYVPTPNSGSAEVGTANSEGRGSIMVGTLEMSNVNLASEFTSMITTERGYQANSKIITVADEMLQDLVNLKR
jgi:flagellar hook protein FlgE